MKRRAFKWFTKLKRRKQARFLIAAAAGFMAKAKARSETLTLTHKGKPILVVTMAAQAIKVGKPKAKKRA